MNWHVRKAHGIFLPSTAAPVHAEWNIHKTKKKLYVYVKKVLLNIR